ncbi:hypothetical protein [Actinoplanes teichomyceticus]|uniref:Uncharacterized protein n=1 Tax=Actinoplanes teichomyceticus TaxID=1867 RepID=A0A561WLY0_ACTTI|nr:hypothetical protein [Actinoplanes teichomyceticus]TWG24877.1 hypothetical protein FHX34_1021440 [Actinoplanes teichomyceticus]GIF15588.1 hypothetical protein Ate01nite_56200 [Actinoplanes teichomyceticus]
MRFGRILMGSALLGAGLLVAPGVAEAAPAAGSCVGGAFRGQPSSGARVSPRQTIRLQLSVEVTGGPVAGCSRDVLLSGPVSFVAAGPSGAYWPATSFGPMAEVDWSGGFPAGTRLHGTITLKVPATAASGAVITATSGSAVTYTVR